MIIKSPLCSLRIAKRWSFSSLPVLFSFMLEMEGMKGMEAQQDQLCLYEDEQESILVDNNFPKIDKSEEKSVVEKVCADRYIGKEAGRVTMGKLWRLSEPASFKEVGKFFFHRHLCNKRR